MRAGSCRARSVWRNGRLGEVPSLDRARAVGREGEEATANSDDNAPTPRRRRRAESKQRYKEAGRVHLDGRGDTEQRRRGGQRAAVGEGEQHDLPWQGGRNRRCLSGRRERLSRGEALCEELGESAARRRRPRGLKRRRHRQANETYPL